MNSKVSAVLKNILALAIGLIVVFILVEVLLRVFPLESSYVRLSAKPDDRVGFTRIPNSVETFSTKCYQIENIRFNSLGFRGAEFRPGGIAILGDSFMEANEVPTEATTASILEQLLRMPVLNTGINAYGNVTQRAVYDSFLTAYRPKLTVLFFTQVNDFKDNSCRLTELYNEPIIQPCGRLESGKVVIEKRFDNVGPREVGGFMQFLRKNCRSCLLAFRMYRYAFLHQIELGEMDFLENSFRKEPVENSRRDWEESRTITEEILVELAAQIRKDGGHFAIAVVPTIYSIAHNWQNYFKEANKGSDVPRDFDPEFVEKYLTELGKKHGIQILLLSQAFREYRDQFALKDPYFWYFCDGHWNPVGHFVAANATAKAILNWGILDLDEQSKQLKFNEIARNLNLSPQEILGEPGYTEVYSGRARAVYTGGNNIPQILSEDTR